MVGIIGIGGIPGRQPGGGMPGGIIGGMPGGPTSGAEAAGWEVIKGPPLRVNFDPTKTRQGCATRLWNPTKTPFSNRPFDMDP